MAKTAVTLKDRYTHKGPAPKCVLVAPLYVVNWVYRAIIPYMREKFGTRFIIVTHEGARKEIHSDWCGEQDVLVTIEEIEAQIGTEQTSDLDEIARRNEEKFGFTYMRDVIQQDRQLSTSFLSHAPWSPYAGIPIRERDTLTRRLNCFVDFAVKTIEGEGVDLLLVWPMTDLFACLANVAEAKNIPVTYPYVSSRKSLKHWSSSAFSDDSMHKSAFDRQPECEPFATSEVVPPASPFPSLAQMDESHSAQAQLREIAKTTFHRLEFLVLDLLKLDFRSKNRTSFLRQNVHLIYKWWFYKRLSKFGEKDVSAFSRPFLYYGLALEPEFSVQGKTKEFNDQSAIIRQLAMCLPSGYDVVIKEHASLGRRHISFYSDLLKFPNVRMAHPSIRGIDLAAKARAVATLSGTVTIEATLLGKPVIEFSTHSVFSFLSNVTTVTSFHDLPDILRSTMRPKTEEESDAIRRDGARLSNAIDEFSFDASDSPIFGGNSKKLEGLELVRVVELLCERYCVEPQR